MRARNEKEKAQIISMRNQESQVSQRKQRYLRMVMVMVIVTVRGGERQNKCYTISVCRKLRLLVVFLLPIWP